MIVIPCSREATTLSECTPQCTRWTQVNEGEPITIYHDTTGWDPTYYPNMSDPDPLTYLQPAIDLWNNEYGGTLYALTNDQAAADVNFQYEPEDPNDPCTRVGAALCACDNEDEVCIRQADHSQVFAITKAQIWMYFVDCIRGLSVNQWINVIVHELGHNLGMGHVYNLPLESVMGTRSDSSQVVRLFDHDVEQLDRRYPTGCIITAPHQVFHDIKPSTRPCPGCLASAYMS